MRRDRSTTTVRRCLNQVIQFAAECEQLVLRAHQKRPAEAVAYATLVAQRRFAEAIRRLGTEGAYEARIILRAMIEHHFNLAWILLKAPHRRAHRFVRFQAIEKFKGLTGLPLEMRPPEYGAVYRQAKRSRARVQHLFRRPDKKGRLVWDKNWAAGKSVEDRMREVLAAEGKGAAAPDMFMYSLYRWFSGVVHGSAQHFEELLEPTRHGVRPKANPDSGPANQMMSASLILTGTLGKSAAVLGFSASMINRLEGLSERCRQVAVENWGTEGPTP